MQVRNRIIPDGKYKINGSIEKYNNNMMNLSAKIKLTISGYRFRSSKKFVNSITTFPINETIHPQGGM